MPRSDADDPTNDPSDLSLLAGKTVVLVEDEGMIQLQLGRILPQVGAIVVGTARTAPDGLAAVLSLRPQVVLMDINLPGDYDGLEAARRILELYSTCIIMLTGYSDAALQQKAMEMGVCAYLTKPVTADMLLPQLEKALRDFGLDKCG